MKYTTLYVFKNLIKFKILNQFSSAHRSAFFIFFAFYHFIGIASGQETGLSTLSIISTGDSTQTSSANNINDSADYDKVKSIYDKLVSARGDYRFPIPTVFLRSEVSRVASIDYDKLEIVLEQKAFQACKPFGDAAIAFLLGHELTHYYEKHAWKSGFATEYKDLKVGREMKSVNDQVANETQADYLGGFLAYSAGYGMFDKGGEIIKAMYSSYGLGNQLPGYPSLQDRVELAKRSSAKIESLIDVFEMANFLSAIGRYAEANEYYKYILIQYQSREIYNNLGVTSVMNALQHLDEKELKYKYVVELDLSSHGSRDASSAAKADNLLREAVKYFDSAISLDPNYAPAYLNKATAYALLGDNVRAKFYAEKEATEIGIKGNFSKTVIDASILKGILLAKEGNTKDAKTIFESAASKGSELAKENLNILTNGSTTVKSPSRTQTPQDTINKMTLVSFARKPQFLQDKVVQINQNLTFFQYQIDSLNFKILYNMNNEDRLINYFMLTKTGKDVKTSKRIGTGDTLDDIIKIYGQAYNRIETPQGLIMIYDNLFFVLGADNKVVKWGNFMSKKSLF